MIAVGWVLLLSAMLWFFVDWNEREANPNRNMKAAAGAESNLFAAQRGFPQRNGREPIATCE